MRVGKLKNRFRNVLCYIQECIGSVGSPVPMSTCLSIVSGSLRPSTKESVGVTEPRDRNQTTDAPIVIRNYYEPANKIKVIRKSTETCYLS